MKKNKLHLKKLMAGIVFLASGPVMAQCSYTPTVTPNDMVLCPQEIDTLWTQSYDSYQWYKDGVALAGETNQYLVVEQYQDAGSMFSVEVSLNNCTESSAQVLVDGHMFMLPYIMSWSNGWISNMGEQEICKGDTLFMELGPLVYDSDIKWFKNGMLIPNANGPLYKATEDGDYSVFASTSICPNFTATPGVELPLIVHDVPVPEIEVYNDTLFVAQLTGGLDYQWYFNGTLLPGETNYYHIPAADGNYTVTASIFFGECEQESEEFFFQFASVAEQKLNALKIYPNPVKDFLIVESTATKAEVVLTDFTGRSLETHLLENGTARISVSGLNPGVYFVQVSEGGKILNHSKFIK